MLIDICIASECTGVHQGLILLMLQPSPLSYLLLWTHALADRILPSAPLRFSIPIDRALAASGRSIADELSTGATTQHNRQAAVRNTSIAHALSMRTATRNRKRDVDRRSRRKLMTVTDSNATHECRA